MRILTVPDDTAALRTKSSPIYEITLDLVNFLRDLGETLKNQRDPQGVGLSAIQVGRPIRAFATWLPKDSDKRQVTSDKPENELLFYINSEIIDHSKELTLGEDLVEANKKQKTKNKNGDNQALGTRYQRPFLEGCLSIPRVYGAVPRWEWIKARATVLSESDVSSPNFALRSSHFTPHARLPARQASRPSVMSSGSNDFTLEKLASRVFQHELDHLNGILFTDRTLEAGLQLYESREKDLVPMEM